jgi:hypothetical protein
MKKRALKRSRRDGPARRNTKSVGSQPSPALSGSYVPCFCGEYSFDTRIARKPYEGVVRGALHTPSRCSGRDGLVEAQRAVNPPSSETAGSSPAATTITIERVCKAFAVLLVRALPVEHQPNDIVVVTHGTGGQGRHYSLDASLLQDLKLVAEFVYIAATRALGASA